MESLEVSRPGELDAGQIRELVQTAVVSVDQAMAGIAMALKHCVLAGEAMNAKKEQIGHGGFEAWLEREKIVGPDRRKQISRSTALRWMGLARFHAKNAAELESCSTITQAYRLAGLLPEPEAAKTNGNGAGGSASVYEAIGRTERTLQEQLAARPIEKWPREDLRLLETRLRGLAELYEAVQRQLNGEAPPQ